jgi:hypothetical protein
VVRTGIAVCVKPEKRARKEKKSRVEPSRRIVYIRKSIREGTEPRGKPRMSPRETKSRRERDRIEEPREMGTFTS